MKSNWGHTSESLELVPCKEFMGPPGSGAALAQPFEVTMHGQVQNLWLVSLAYQFSTYNWITTCLCFASQRLCMLDSTLDGGKLIALCKA